MLVNEGDECFDEHVSSLQLKRKGVKVVVIGAGIGGLTVAALLARKGFNVSVLESQPYPGGCAATFEHNGYRFDAGATVGCGFHKKGPLDLLGEELGISWPIMSCPAAWDFIHGDRIIHLSHSRQEILREFPGSISFWEEQDRLVSLLWSLAAEALPWPPSGMDELSALFRKTLRKAPVLSPMLPLVNKTALQWLASYGLDTDSDFVRFIDAQLLISVQTTAQYANAVNAAIALDLPSKGTHRLTGGIGSVAEKLAAAVNDYGGEVMYGASAQSIQYKGRRVFSVKTSDETCYPADIVVANLTPDSLSCLFGENTCPEAGIKRGPVPEWSAFVLYLGIEESAFSEGPVSHVQIVGKSGDLGEGNSLFVSVSPSDDSLRAPEGFRAVTVSTHTRPELWFEAKSFGKEAYGKLKDSYTSKVMLLLAKHFHGIEQKISTLSAATPVTWERYTGRRQGYVGGYPQKSLFNVRGPGTPFKNLFLTGDSVFPGQSLPGVVTGARRVAELVERRFGSLG